MLTSREFLGIDYYAWVQSEFDNARRYLRTCGKPTSQYDVAMIQFNKQTVEIFKCLLN